jgi:O-antigen/teichoic acid export membrane protein
VESTGSARPASRNVAWTLLGNVAYAFSQWAMTIALAKLGNEGDVGEFALAWAYTSPLIVFSGLQLRNVLVSDVLNRFRFKDFLSLRVGLTASAVVLIVLTALWRRGPGVTLGVICAVALTKGLDSISDIYYGAWQRADRMDWIAKGLLLNAAASIGFVVVAMVTTGNVVVAAFASTLGSSVGLAYALRRVPMDTPAVPERWNVRRIMQLASTGFPLGIVMALLALQANVPRYFIEHYWGVGQLGVFAALTQLTLAGGNVVAAIGSVASSRLARYYAGGNTREFVRLLASLAAIGVGLGIGGTCLALAAGSAILTVLYSAEYSAAAPVLVWLSLAAGISYASSFLGYGMTMAGERRSQPVLFAGVAVVTMAACALFVPSLGLRGAAAAVALASAFQMCGSFFVLRNAIRRGGAVVPAEPRVADANIARW